ncbi:MAG: nuclear transport factor 2 family protein, partial [Bacteroidota bacterium]
LLFFICSVILVTPHTYGQVLETKDVDAIKQVMSMQENAWNEGDIPQFMEGYWKSDSLLFIGSSGPTYGWQATYERYERVYPDRKTMGQLQFDILEIRSLGQNYARLIGKFHLKREEIDDLEGYFTLIWKKIGGKWLIISDHTS